MDLIAKPLHSSSAVFCGRDVIRLLRSGPRDDVSEGCASHLGMAALVAAIPFRRHRACIPKRDHRLATARRPGAAILLDPDRAERAHDRKEDRARIGRAEDERDDDEEAEEQPRMAGLCGRWRAAANHEAGYGERGVTTAMEVVLPAIGSSCGDHHVQRPPHAPTELLKQIHL